MAHKARQGLQVFRHHLIQDVTATDDRLTHLLPVGHVGESLLEYSVEDLRRFRLSPHLPPPPAV
eukprot:487918-Hanusia_phi.AAC.2